MTHHNHSDVHTATTSQYTSFDVPSIEADTETTVVYHDWESDDDLHYTIVTAVADVAGVDPIELTPLYSAIDPDALDAVLVDSSGSPQNDAGLWFNYEGYQLFVRSDGTITIHVR